MKKNIIITTGDVDGIGPEVTSKAISYLKNSLNDKSIFVFKSSQSYQPEFELLFSNNTIEFDSFKLGLEHSNKNTKDHQIYLINSPLSPAHWVKEAAKICHQNPSCFTLVTAPLSKQNIINSGLNYIGHTEILRSVTKSPHLFMTFIGQQFSTLLVTGHIALHQVSQQLSLKLLSAALSEAQKVKKLLKDQRPIALVGLNPHASENGLMGNEEITLYKKVLSISKFSDILGPLVPDAAFLPSERGKYSLIVSPYHDQGLIPFKALHGHNDGIHITMGLPFLRTSVNHGTAKEIFRKNKANPNSMIQAINFALNS